MSDLSTNVNVRTTHEMKKRIMDEAHKRGMTISECILFSLEDYWNIIEKGNIANNSQLSTLLQETQAELNDAKTQIEDLKNEKNELKSNNGKKSFLREANETAGRLSQERIEQERAIAVREFVEENLDKFANSDQAKLQFYTNRLSQYETDVLKEIFKVVRENTRIKDLPDVVQMLANIYYQQFINKNQHVQLK